jgi:hypothetical protein
MEKFELKMRCNLCGKIVEGNLLEHIKNEHKPSEFFTPVWIGEWE